jgi:hypothetical protein
MADVGRELTRPMTTDELVSSHERRLREIEIGACVFLGLLVFLWMMRR